MKYRFALPVLAGILLSLSPLATAQVLEENGEVSLPEEKTLYPTEAPIQSAGAFAKSSAPANRFAAENPDWMMYAPYRSGTPHRAWGKGIAIEDYHTINLLNAESAARAFIDARRDVFGAESSRLRLLYAQMVNGKAYVRFIQQHEGLDVLFHYVDLRITSGGKVVMFGSDAGNTIGISTNPALSVHSAKDFAGFGLDYQPGTERIDGGRLLVLPIRNGQRVDYHLAYNFTVTMDEDEIWDTYVDANDGKVLWRKSLILHGHDGDGKQARPAANIATGQILVKVHKDDPREEEEYLPCPYQTINFQGVYVQTDADGRFSIDLGSRTSATGVAKLVGPYAESIRNDIQDPNDAAIMAVPVSIDQETTHYWDDASSHTAERNGFYHTTIVSRWIRELDGSENMLHADSLMPVNVNYGQQSCNANWNGQAINFYRETSSCRNTAVLPSVIYHEYGHAINTFLYHALMGMRTFNRAMEEGNADITAAMILDDPRIGLGMFKNDGEGLLRNCDNTLRYPDDFSGQIHSDGRILAGAVWDTRKLIGLETTARLSHYVKYGAPDNLNYGIALADYFIEFLIADDDNADLSDGTPHSESIVEAFRKHGIPASGISISHTEIANIQTSVSPHVFTGIAKLGSVIAPDRIYVEDVRLVFSHDNWKSSESIEMTYDPVTAEFEGVLPALPDGSIVRYYFEAKDNIGSSMRYPTPVPSAAFAFVVGFQSIHYTDMAADEGWTVSGDASTGIWLRAKPRGTYPAAYVSPPYIPWVQPDFDHTFGTDSLCWVTGNTAPDEDIQFLMSRQDVDDGATILTSSEYDIALLKNPVLRYYRWYTNNAGSTPNQDEWVVQISTNSGVSWTDLERTTESIANWTPRIFMLDDYIGPDAQSVMVRFIAEDAEPGSLVEAAVDDFEILDFEIPVAVGDIPAAGTVTLHQNYPNPFNPSTDIRFTLPSRRQATLKVLDLLGNEVAVLYDGVADAGTNAATFDATGLPSGLYIYRLTTAEGAITKKMVLAK